MKFFAVALCLALVATNEAFILDSLQGLVDTIKEQVLPGLVQTGLTALLGSLGKRDVELDSLALLEDAVTDKNERLTQMQTLMQKLSEARKAGNVQEVLTNHLKEQREKYLQRLTPEQRQKYEEHVKQLKETHATWSQKMAAYKKTQETCRTAVQTAKDAAAKTAETTDGSRMQLFKVYTDCLKAASQKTEETKTQEDTTSFKETMEKFRTEFLEAQKNGKLAEFLKTHHENVKSKLAEMHKTMIAKITDEQKTRLEQHKQSVTALTSTLQTCRTQVAALKDASRIESAKAFVKCMLEARNAKTETKTQEDAVRMTAAERAEFMKKYEEAKKAGTLREFLQKHHEEQHKQAEEARNAYMLKRTECMKKVEEAKKAATDVTKFDARMEMRSCMMTEEQKKMEEMKTKCYAEAKAKKAEAEKAKTAFTRMDFYKTVRECMKPEETKTQEDSRMTQQEREEFQKKLEEAKAAGTEKEFLENYRKEKMAQKAAERKVMEAKKQECMKTVEAAKAASAKPEEVNGKKEMRMCMMTDEQKARYQKAQECRAKAQEAKTAAEAKNEVLEKNAVWKMVRECMRPPMPNTTTTTMPPRTTMMADTTTMSADTTTMMSDFNGRMTPVERAEFMKKYEEAKKAGTLREFLQKHHEEQHKQAEEARKAYMLKKTECMKKVEEAKKAATDVTKFDARMEMRSCMMTEEQKKMEEMKTKCYAEAKAKKEEAEKAKTAFTRMDFYKTIHECMKPEETKTQEDAVVEAKKQECMKTVEAAKAASAKPEEFNGRKEMRMCMMTDAQKARYQKSQECRAMAKEAKTAAEAKNEVFGKQAFSKMVRQCMRPPMTTTTTAMPPRTTEAQTTMMPDTTTMMADTTTMMADTTTV